MSTEHVSRRSSVHLRSRWSGTAFLVEAMLLLVFVVASIAVITQLFSASVNQIQDSERLSQAVALTTSQAERFAASPGSAAGEESSDDLRIVCEVEDERTAAGTLYRAHITAYDQVTNEVVYSIDTSRYESEVS